MALYRCMGAIEKPTLLWTNPSPTSQFAGQDVALDLTGYKVLLIKFYIGLAYGADKIITKTVYDLEDTNISNINLSATAISSGSKNVRQCNKISTGVHFNGGQYGLGSNFSSSNFVCVPVEIYGYKTNILKT